MKVPTAPPRTRTSTSPNRTTKPCTKTSASTTCRPSNSTTSPTATRTESPDSHTSRTTCSSPQPWTDNSKSGSSKETPSTATWTAPSASSPTSTPPTSNWNSTSWKCRRCRASASQPWAPTTAGCCSGWGTSWSSSRCSWASSTQRWDYFENRVFKVRYAAKQGVPTALVLTWNHNQTYSAVLEIDLSNFSIRPLLEVRTTQDQPKNILALFEIIHGYLMVANLHGLLSIYDYPETGAKVGAIHHQNSLADIVAGEEQFKNSNMKVTTMMVLQKKSEQREGSLGIYLLK